MNTLRIELCSEESCDELQAFLVERIYEFNEQSTGYFDGKLLGGRLRSETGETIGAFNGHTWGRCCVIDHLWVNQFYRGRGHGQALLNAAESEAVRRGCEQVVLATHSFQAPAFYERFGYERRAIIEGRPKGHAYIIYAKRLTEQNGT
jgi:ribosomal protein S18 acetylase RimI-like enzyme